MNMTLVRFGYHFQKSNAKINILITCFHQMESKDGHSHTHKSEIHSPFLQQTAGEDTRWFFFSIASYYTIVVHLFDWNALFIPCLNSYTLLFCEYSDLIRNIWRICECVFLFQKRWMCVIWFKSPICGCQKTAHTNSQCNLIIEHFNKRTQF